MAHRPTLSPNASNTLSVPTKTLGLSHKVSNSPNAPSLKPGISQYFHGTRKYGSFSKSTIKKKRAKSDNFVLESNDMCTLSSICNFFNFLPILHPVGPLKCCWDGIVMIMLIYTSVEIPYTLSFNIDLKLNPNDVFGCIAFCIDICLCIDIIFNFRTAYFDKFDHLKLIINPIIIAKRYLRGWFVLDLLTSIPIEFMIPYQHNVTTYIKIFRVFRLIRVVKILRLLKMVKLFDGVMRRIVVREMLVVLRLSKILAFMLLYAHWSACLWYYIGCDSNKIYHISWLSEHTDLVHECHSDETNMPDIRDMSPVFTRYSYSWYWSVVTLFTTGYGDITAQTIREQWICSISILIGTCFFAYFIGTLTTLISEGDRISSEVMSKMEEAQHFCDKKKLPKEMTRAVLTHTRYHCNYNYILDDHSVLNNLPPYLQMDISLYISKRLMLQNIDFFDEHILDPVVRGSIAIKMRSISCNNGYKLYRKGDLAKEIYIQRTGKSIHLFQTKQGKKKRIQLNRGDVCGEYSLIKKKRASTVLCATWCEFYVIEINDIIEVLQEHYGNRWEKKWLKMRKFVKMEYNKPLSWRKKRHLTLKRRITPDVSNYNENSQTEEIGQELQDEGGMHAAWMDAPRPTIRSTIRSEGVNENLMFQNILNDQDSIRMDPRDTVSVLSMFPDGSFIGKSSVVSDRSNQPSIAEEKNQPQMELPELPEHFDLTNLDVSHAHSLTVKDAMNVPKHKVDYSASLGRMNTASTIHDIRQDDIRREQTQRSMLSQTKAKSLDTNIEMQNNKSQPLPSKSPRKTLKWLDSLRGSTDTLKRGSTKVIKPKVSDKNSAKKKGHKKKKKSLWFGSMRQNSELRDQAVVAGDSMNIDVLREIFADYNSDIEDGENSNEGNIFNTFSRAKSERHIRREGMKRNQVSTDDLDIMTVSEPVICVVKQRSRSLGGDDKLSNKMKYRKYIEKNKKQIDEYNINKIKEINEVNDQVNDVNDMEFIDGDDDSHSVAIENDNDSMESFNTDSISIGNDLDGSESSNTFESEPKLNASNTTNRNKKAKTNKMSGNKGKHGKFGAKGKKHIKKVANKVNKTVMFRNVVNDLDPDDIDDLPNTSLGPGLVNLSQIEENDLINKSLSSKLKGEKELQEIDENNSDDLNIEEIFNTHLHLFEDNDTVHQLQ